MKRPQDRSNACRPPAKAKTFPRPGIFPVALLLFFSGAAQAQTAWPLASAQSISGQFIVIAAPRISSLADDRAVATNSDFVRLDPALLAVSAERVKKSLWQQLQIEDKRQWRGQIFLALHPARTLDESVTIVSSRFNNIWTYRVELPDVVRKTRLMRALTGAVLLEFANRNAGDHSAEVPAWLVDGLAEQLLAANSSGLVISSPMASGNDIPEKRIVSAQRGWDLLVHAHEVLQDETALTFEQMSWPTDEQLSGRDGGVYRASAQLFVTELLARKNGAKELGAMLQALPRFYNWQMAFHDAFEPDFPQPVDVEKWWAMQTVDFATLDLGPVWTPAASRGKLDEILRVPVEYRSASNNVPTHAEISLQSVIRNFDPARRLEILQPKLHDLQLVELRMPQPFAQLTEQYRQTLADYLGQSPPPRRVILGKNSAGVLSKPSARDTIKKLDVLDARRRTLESSPDGTRPAVQMPALTGRESNL